jgi:hypothetical protein
LHGISKERDMRTSVITGLGGAALLALVAGCNPPRVGTALPRVPENLRPPATQKLALEADASGVQIYDCKASPGDAAQFEWTLRAPEAELFDHTGKRIGIHYGGPTWESYDGSKVVGEVEARSDSPDPKAIPWLLLAATSATGDGVLGRTASIQRAQTVGGKAPRQGCSAAFAGNEVRVPYTATYYFYETRS